MKNTEKLNKAISEANSKFKKLSELDPNFKKKAYMVHSSKFGQCGLSEDLLSILKEFPKALSPEDLVKRTKELLDLKATAIKEGKSTQGFDNEIKENLEKLEIKEEVNIELRYNPGTLDYVLIQKVMESEAISKEFTKSPLAPVLVSFKAIIGE